MARWQPPERRSKVIVAVRKWGDQRSIDYDDVLTAEIVKSYKTRGATLVMIRRYMDLRFIGRDADGPYIHVYPAVEETREVPLMKLLVSLEIKFGAALPIKAIPQEWLNRKSHVRPLKTKEDVYKAEKRREEAIRAAGKRIIDKKVEAVVASVREEEAIEAFFLSEEERDCDVW